MSNLEKWEKVEPLLKRLASAKTSRPEDVLTELVELVEEFWPKLEQPALLSDEKVMESLPRLKDLVCTLISRVAEDGETPKDADHYIYACAVEMFYGDDIWPWYNKRVR